MFWKKQNAGSLKRNQIEKPLAKLRPKIKGEKIQITKIKSETRDIYSKAC